MCMSHSYSHANTRTLQHTHTHILYFTRADKYPRTHPHTNQRTHRHTDRPQHTDTQTFVLLDSLYYTFYYTFVLFDSLSIIFALRIILYIYFCVSTQLLSYINPEIKTVIINHQGQEQRLISQWDLIPKDINLHHQPSSNGSIDGTSYKDLPKVCNKGLLTMGGVVRPMIISHW